MPATASLARAPAPAESRPDTAPERSVFPVDRASAASWLAAYRTVREETERRAAGLSEADQTVQSMADASPTKWHRAHTTWFFETFLLAPHLAGYRPFDPQFGFLFNSYYEAVGARMVRAERGLLTRPTAAAIGAYRAHVDTAMARLIAPADPPTAPRLFEILEIGLHHEQQHQELLVTDILHAFAQNPIAPAYDAAWRPAAAAAGDDLHLSGGIVRIGHAGTGFAFDNEGPVHDVLIEPVDLAGGLVTNADWLAFMAAGGYDNAALWLSDGWATVRREGWRTPGYWEERDGAWMAMTLAGLRPVDPAAPVCHVSYYEADAFARWAGRDLPTEFEWEAAASTGGLAGAFGQVWQWTRSAYAPYPRYRPTEGALGEYNGKFMVNQMVLRGSSLATPAGHARPTYRNFFYPHQRWQFTGLRLSSYAA
jgi:ergothioneine biosynthesis protein EgtB